MIGRKIIHIESLDSTNNYVAKLYKENKIESGTVIMADYQRCGKGQREAEWQSEPYKNILFSCFVEHDKLSVNDYFKLNQTVSIACLFFLKNFNSNFKIKWPNDLVFGNSKIGGILIENHLEKDSIKNSIIGIGLNINQTDFNNFNATSLKLILGQEFPLRDLSFSIVKELNTWFLKFNKKNYPEIQKNYLENLWLLNEDSCFEDSQGEFIGKITGIGETGELIVLKNNVMNHYHNKEIVFKERDVF
jgi:BirA family transcriptional regulator, biotin operon repressor / biotin---[acetyl-CoA-carboxylase] ligase